MVEEAQLSSAVAASTATYVAFLRGINVGGSKPVPMGELSRCLERLGYADVKTYINSGNVVFRTSARGADVLEPEIESALSSAFSMPIRVFVRTVADLGRIVDEIGRLWKEDTDDRQNVIFLSRSLDGEDVLVGLRPRDGAERVSLVPGALLWSVPEPELTRSQMLKLNRLPVYQEMTVRGPSTVRKVYELMLAADTS
jgi:uncharacterized protein (DUF1697 family)